MFWGSKFTHFCASVRPSVRACVRASGRPPVKIQVVIGVFLEPKIKIQVLILFVRSPPKMHGQVRWSKFRSRDLTAKKYHRPVRWPKIPTEGLDGTKTQIAKRASTSKMPELTADRTSTSKTNKPTADRAYTSKTPVLTADRAFTSKTPRLMAKRASRSNRPKHCLLYTSPSPRD